jgi:AraC-like DNA-binding protein
VDALDELRSLVLRHAGGQVRRTILPGVTIATVDGPTLPASVISEPSLAVIGQGVKRTVLNGTAYDYRAGQYLVVSIDLPVTGLVLEATPEHPFVIVSMALDAAAIAALLVEAAESRDDDGLSSSARARAAIRETKGAGIRPAFTGLAISDAGADLLDPVVRLLRLLDQPGDVAMLGPAFQREILWRLLTGEQGPLVRQIGLAGGGLASVARAIRWIRSHYREQLRVDDLARLADMSVSTFHRHFRRATSMTPVQFQKQIRLQEARALLMTGPAEIAEVGYLVGYDSPSQFSREYRRAFGEPPGRDAVRLRASGESAETIDVA